ncbi:hypothetical protein [Janibacter massiliensis]|uniref:hypothetical protein n=1 Tax=Janibacter massiliensis TaxID=2058291 RepID=UPI000D10580F|nr:hypothetical protein [Janibacter massiliensis]
MLLLDAAAAPWIARSLAGDRSAERRYEDSLAGLLDRFPARHPMGPHRRWCLVRDAWALAEHRARTARGERLPPPARPTCCLLVRVPGCTECAGCPR